MKEVAVQTAAQYYKEYQETVLKKPSSKKEDGEFYRELEKSFDEKLKKKLEEKASSEKNDGGGGSMKPGRNQKRGSRKAGSAKRDH